VFAGSALRAVVVVFCGDDATHAGAIELWHNDPAQGPDMRLDDGYYGHTAEIFEFVSRHTTFRIGNGLPGLAWQSGLPVFMPDLGKGTRFMRADSAVKVGINRGFAIPCSTPGADQYVMAFLSALDTPTVRRFEIWELGSRRTQVNRSSGFCESAGLLAGAPEGAVLEIGEGAIGSAFASGIPSAGSVAAIERHLGPSAQAVGLQTVVALPVLRDGLLRAVVAWYF
jgi:hypothetical protein